MALRDSKLPRLVGILNITQDSFSDGGRYLDPESALARARSMRERGADIVELGPASSHPDPLDVAPEEEIRRIEPVAEALRDERIPFAVDSFRVETQRWSLEHGASLLNDIQGFPHPEIWSELAGADCRLVVMHSVQDRGRATREHNDPAQIIGRIETFFEERVQELEQAGIARDRLILDPGMGFFLGDTPDPSLRVLAALPGLRERFGLPLLVSVSRKSFLGALLRDSRSGEPRPIDERLPATLAAEIFAAEAGADYIRTHDVRALRDALVVRRQLAAAVRDDLID
jgi:dihydropteroate synthase type 2